MLDRSGRATRRGTTPTGVARFPAIGAPSLSVSGFVPASGGTRHDQVRYRDGSPVFCNASIYNWTNGHTIVWTP